MNLPPRQLMIGLSVIGVLIAIQINYIQHGWINNDSVLYFESARLFATGEWQQGFKLFPWPLYSGLIALVHSITGFSLHFSAQLLNVIFFGIASFAFLQLIRLCGGDNRTLLSGALLLYSSQYIVGDALQMLLRDQGFWAFFLTALVFFIRFYRSRSWQDALGWQIAMILAMLFRIEGFTYLALLPLILLFNNDLIIKARVLALLRAHSLNLIITIVVSLYFISTSKSVGQLGRLKEILTPDIFSDLLKKFLDKSNIMAEDVLGSFLDEFAIEGLLLTFLMVMIAKTISTSGWVAIGLATYTTKLRTQLLPSDARLILASVIAIALLNMLLIILKVFVLSGRYVIPLSLILILLAAFGFAELWRRREAISKRLGWLTAAITIVLMLGLVKNVLPKIDGYNYQQEAVTWLQSHNTKASAVFYDSSRVRYYAGAPFIGTWMDIWKVVKEATEDGSIRNYEYLMISIEDSESWKVDYLEKHLAEYKEIYRASNPKGNKFLVVYQRQSPL